MPPKKIYGPPTRKSSRVSKKALPKHLRCKTSDGHRQLEEEEKEDAGQISERASERVSGRERPAEPTPYTTADESTIDADTNPIRFAPSFTIYSPEDGKLLASYQRSSSTGSYVESQRMCAILIPCIETHNVQSRGSTESTPAQSQDS